MKNLSVFFGLLLSISLIGAVWAQEAFNHTGLPLPRFVSLNADEANLRTGPGKKYPIKWVYHRNNLPLEIISEFDSWRKVKDPQGAEGWMHVSLLSGSRYGFTNGSSFVSVYKRPKGNVDKILDVGSNHVVKLHACKLDWCQISIQNYRGWVLKTDIYGVYDHETFN